jgi:hypothetical protein
MWPANSLFLHFAVCKVLVRSQCRNNTDYVRVLKARARACVFAGLVRSRDGSRDDTGTHFMNLPSPNVQSDVSTELLCVCVVLQVFPSDACASTFAPVCFQLLLLVSICFLEFHVQSIQTRSELAFYFDE